jgi:hypothetical protein
MPLQPSRRDVLGSPKRDVTDLGPLVRHHESYLRSLDPGITGGRFATPRPPGQGGGSQLVGDDGDGGDGCDPIGEDGDRLTLANLSTQVWTLSYTPIAETLHVHWHPNGGAGVEWKRGEHYELAEDDQIVTIYASALTSGRARVGDVFSAQYLRLDCEEDDAAEPPEPVVASIRAGRGAKYGTSGVPTTIALPVSPAPTEVGDLVAIVTNRLVTDGRFTQVGSTKLWVGVATTLADISVDMSYGGPGLNFWSIACISLDTNAVAWSTESTAADPSMTSADTMSIPQIPGVRATICGLYSTHSIVDGSTSHPTGYASSGGSSTTGKTHCRVDLWTSAVDDTSSAGPAAFNGGGGRCEATVVSLIGP